jgi:hypothetical protein
VGLNKARNVWLREARGGVGEREEGRGGGGNAFHFWLLQVRAQ